MALLTFPNAPVNGQLYPVTPVVGQNQYRWSSADNTWVLEGAATAVTPGTYGDANNVGQFTVDAQGRVIFAQNVPIASGAGGTVTSITAGTGLTGGTITATGTIALDPTAVIPPSDFTAVGDILVGTGAGTYSALAVGADGDVLTANSTCAEGVEWVASSGATPATPTVEGTVFALTDGAVTLNTALGFDALNTTATGAGNVAVGPSAGCALTIGSINTLIGPAAGCSILDSTQNIAIGFQALGALTTGTGSNIAIGSLAGSALTNEDFNVVIGAHPGPVGLNCQIVLADGQGTLRAQINECGAISPDGAAYGTLGQFLGSNGATSNWSWIEGVRRVATPTSSAVGGVLGEVAIDTGYFYWFDGTQWLRAVGSTF
jgi:hypothetical protein